MKNKERENNMYLFISEDEIQAYKGEVLKRYIGAKLVKTISNPTDEDLKEFGYRPLENTAEVPEYNTETQYVSAKYTETEDKIIQTYVVHDYPEEAFDAEN